MPTTTVSNPGRIGLTQIHGKTGVAIRVAQYLNGSGFEDYEHAFIDLGDGTAVEAEPGGARVTPLHHYDPSTVHWCDSIYASVRPDERAAIANEARKFIGVPYSYLDYWALVLHHFHVKDEGLRRYIASTDHVICSQLCDAAYTNAGQQIFKDGRWAGYVTPGDLYLRDMLLEADGMTMGSEYAPRRYDWPKLI